jgi:hypothetical protein
MQGATGSSTPAQRPPAPGPAQRPPEPGDFTRMFSAPKPPGPAGGGDYTDSLYKGAPQGGSGLPPSSSGGAPPPPPPGGSEYTRALQRVSFSDMKAQGGAKPAGKAPAGKGGEAKPAAGAESVDEDGEKKTSYLPVILIVVGLIVVLVIVVVVFSSLSGL